MEDKDGELVIDDSSGNKSEEGECSSDSDGEERSSNLLGIPVENREEPKITDEKETGSEVEDEGREEEKEDEVEEESGDRIEPEKLMQLGSSDTLKGMLCNPHLRQLLVEVHRSRDPQFSVQRAMNIPVFIEFADECLRICGFHDDRK